MQIIKEMPAKTGETINTAVYFMVLAEKYKQAAEAVHYYGPYNMCLGYTRDALHIFDNIEELAWNLGVNRLSIDIDSMNNKPYKKYFMHGNTKVFQLLNHNEVADDVTEILFVGEDAQNER